MAAEVDHSARVQLSRLIDDATTSVDPQLNLSLIRAIKNVVRSSDAAVHLAHELLLYKLKKNHSQVRYLAVLIVDQLFVRSKLFRSLLVLELESYMQMTIGYRAEHALPPPAEQAATLRKKSLEFLQKWNGMFGQHYRQLRLGYEYLKNTLRLQFPDGNEENIPRRSREREERTNELLKAKFLALQGDFLESKVEIRSTMHQIQECFEILVGKEQPSLVCTGNKDGRMPELDLVDEDGGETGAYGVRGLRRMGRERDGLPADEPADAQETQDNKPVFDNLRDLYRLLLTQHVCTAQDWLSTLMRVDPPDRRARDALLREVIDLRNELLAVQRKCEKLGVQVAVDGEDDMDGVVWETGDKITDGSPAEVMEEQKLPSSSASAPETGALLAGSSSGASRSQEQKSSSSLAVAAGPYRSRVTSSSGASISGESKQKASTKGGPRDDLLSSAPVLPWGAYLDGWGAESAVPANQRGLLLESHWGKVDYDACIPADRIAQFSMRSSVFEPEKREIRPCLAPLRKGGLCQRRDMHTCPLHGRIVPRDAKGNPILEERTAASVTESASNANRSEVGDAQTGTSEITDVSLARQALANVRGQDKMDDKLKKKQLAKSQAKRDREHNELVLRTAAISHSSQGFDEIIAEPGVVEDSQTPRKKRNPSLSSMLRKKPSTKDRLGKRLLSGRVRDASVEQQIRDQESSYREAFANQW